MPRSKVSICVICMIIAIMMAVSCSDKSTSVNPNVKDDFNYENYNIQSLPLDMRWFDYMYPIGYDLNFPHDRNGVILYEQNGNYFYHPYMVANRGLWYLAGYQQTSDPAYLDLTLNYADKLLEIADRSEGALYFPYTFDYRLHGSTENDVLLAPWYSGFAQSFVLSLFSRIFETTGDQKYKAAADSVFASYLNTDTSSRCVTAMIDSQGYYWVEEYPYDPPTHVINGFTFSILALEDYYVIEPSTDCETIIRGCCTTLEAYFDEFRNPGGISYYCLLHKTPLLDYHELVINEMRYITRVAGDSIFSYLADTLYVDYHR